MTTGIDPILTFLVPYQKGIENNTFPTLKGKRIRVIEISKEDKSTNEIWKQFKETVAQGYHRYGASNLKREGLDENGRFNRHLVALTEENEIVSTLTIQQDAPDKGVEVTAIFTDANGNPNILTPLRKKAGGKNGYLVEAKNLTVGNRTPHEQALALNIIVAAASKALKEAHKGKNGIMLETLAVHVYTFVKKCGLDPEIMNLIPSNNTINELACEHFQYFFGKGIYTLIKKELVNTLLAEKRTEYPDNKAFFTDALRSPESWAATKVVEVLKDIIGNKGIYPLYSVSKEETRKAFAPYVYQIGINELYDSAQKNLDAITADYQLESFSSIVRKTRGQIEKPTKRSIKAPLAKIITTEEAGHLIATNSSLQIITIPEESNIKDLLINKDNQTIISVLNPAMTQKGVCLSESKILLIRIPKGINIKKYPISLKQARNIFLTYSMGRAISYAFYHDFDPNKNSNFPFRVRIWNYLNTPGTHFEKISNLKTLIVGGGTVGFSSLIGQINHGANNISICELEEETMGVHNVERMAGAKYSDLNKTKTAFLRRAIQESSVPFSNNQVIPRGILSLKDAQRMIENQEIIISAIDNAQVMYWIHKAAKKQGIPVILPTDIDGGTKLSIFDYRNQKTKLFNGLLSKEVIEAFAAESANKKQLAEVIKSVVGGRHLNIFNMKINIPLFDLILGLPVASVIFFSNMIKKVVPNLAQDNIGASVTGVTIQTILSEFARSRRLPKSDAIIIPSNTYFLGIFGIFGRIERVKSRLSAVKKLFKAIINSTKQQKTA